MENILSFWIKRGYYPLRFLFVCSLGLLIYAQTFAFGFVFDDDVFIVHNFCIKHFSDIPYMWLHFPKTRLVGIYSFALNYHWGALDPWGYHVFNLGVHLLTTFLIWLLTATLFKTSGESFIVALLFLVHPCQTQAVAYISQRFESMATLFYVGSLLCFVRGRCARKRWCQTSFLIGAGVLAVAGIFTKETVVTLPLMMLVMEWIFFSGSSGSFKEFFRSKQCFWMLLIAGIFFLLFEKNLGSGIAYIFHFKAPSASHDGDMLTTRGYLLTQMRVFLTLMRVLFVPIFQNVDYDYPLSADIWHPPLTVVGLGVIVAMITSVVYLRRRWPLIAFGVAWILITFSINVAPRVNVIFEHKLYLISYGFFLILTCVLSLWIKNRKVLISVFVVLIGLLSFVSYQRNHVWQNEASLWHDVVLKSPYKARGYISLSHVYTDQNKMAQALRAIDSAIRLNPNIPDAYIGRGHIYAQQGQYVSALLDFNKAIALEPANPLAYYDKGCVLERQGRLYQALDAYRASIARSPHESRAYFNIAGVYAKQGQWQALIRYTLYALRMDPYSSHLDRQYAHVYNNLGVAFIMRGNRHQATLAFMQALIIDPLFVEARRNLARLQVTR